MAKRIAPNYSVEFWTVNELANLKSLRNRYDGEQDPRNYTSTEIKTFNSRIKQIRESFRKFGFLETCPLIVTNIGGQFYLVDGQGRKYMCVHDLDKDTEVLVLVVNGITEDRADTCVQAQNSYVAKWTASDKMRANKEELATYTAQMEAYYKLAPYYINMFLWGSGNLKPTQIDFGNKSIDECRKPNGIERLEYVKDMCTYLEELGQDPKPLRNTDMANFFYRIFNFIDSYVVENTTCTKEELIRLVKMFICSLASNNIRVSNCRGKAENYNKWIDYFISNKSHISELMGRTSNKYTRFLHALLESTKNKCEE